MQVYIITFLQDFEEEGKWCDEMLAVCSASITAKDLRALNCLQQKHKALEDEIVRGHRPGMNVKI
jgi:hypothetical protein